MHRNNGSILVQTCVALVALAIVSQLISTIHQYGYETLGNQVEWIRSATFTR